MTDRHCHRWLILREETRRMSKGAYAADIDARCQTCGEEKSWTTGLEGQRVSRSAWKQHGGKCACGSCLSQRAKKEPTIADEVEVS